MLDVDAWEFGVSILCNSLLLFLGEWVTTY